MSNMQPDLWTVIMALVICIFGVLLLKYEFLFAGAVIATTACVMMCMLAYFDFKYTNRHDAGEDDDEW